ncbi:MAG: 4Fe-4S binding protein [Methanomassiliicoccales archaeon]|nr:4Fe-4S binding protein [Methanomassiliicoccales archaeon]
MTIHIEPLRCIGCGLCELACSFRRERVLTSIRSSIMLHMEDRRNYFGVIIKLPDGGMVLGRPEGLETVLPGGGPGGSKPVLLREPCDECGGDRPRCVAICPSECLSWR